MELRIALLLVLLWTGCGEDTINYEGLRLDMSALTMNRDILSVLAPAFERVKNHSFPDVREHGILRSLSIRDIRITEWQLNENLFDMMRFNFAFPIYTLSGDPGAVQFKLAFSFRMTWLGLPLASGGGVGEVNKEKNEILVLYNESDPDVKLLPPWHVTNIRLDWSLFSPGDWVREVLEKRFIPEFDRILDDCMFDFAHKLLRPYRYIEDSFPDNIDLVFRNEIIEVKPTASGSYLSIGFKTNVTVDNHYVRKVHRRQVGYVNPRKDFNYCFSSQMIPATIDILGKAGYYTESIGWEQWGFLSNSVRELFAILPHLRDIVEESYTFTIECRTSLEEPVNDQRDKNDMPILRYLYPYFCEFTVAEMGIKPLKVDVFVTIFYEMVAGINDKVFYGSVRYSELAGFEENERLPPNRRAILEDHARQFCSYFIDKKLASPGIHVYPNRVKELVWNTSEINHFDEICFYYDEKRK